MKNTSSNILSFLGRVEMVEYVQGTPPDRWHWCKNCTLYPLGIDKSRSKRPDYDLCDQCKKLEKKQTCVNC